MKIRSAMFLAACLFVGAFCAAQSAVPPTFFGLHWYYSNPYPTIPHGAVRLWDTNKTRWQVMNPSSGVYDFTNLDNALKVVKTNGITQDVLLTLGATPQYASSDPLNTLCEYNPTSGSCGVPTDIAASCTDITCGGKTDGTNQMWRNYMYALAEHIKQLSSAYQPVTSLEIWNEFTAHSGTQLAAWEGNDAQLARLSMDANCIFTGRGANCTAASMNVPAVGIIPTMLITTPNAVMEPALDSSEWGAYVKTPGALNVDVAAVHTYTGGPSPTVAEKVATMFTSTNNYLVAAGSSCAVVLCWSTEGSFGTQATLESDVDLQAAFVARYYLVGWSSGFQRMYWYSYSANNVGTLWVGHGTPGCTATLGCLTLAGVAYQTIYGWMVGHVMSTPCSSVGTTWTCGLTAPGRTTSDLVVWDTAQTLSYSITPGKYASYSSLDGTTTPIGSADVSVSVGAKPIRLNLSSHAVYSGTSAIRGTAAVK